MTDHTTHDLAIARAERDAWQSTCEELHRAIAGANVEIEAHLGRCEAADQRARSFEAALTAEREASKGVRASAYENRGALVDVADDLHVDTIDVSSTDVATRCGVAIAKLRFELAAIRDLVAPGNPQGAVVDAVRAMIARWSADLRDLHAAIARAEKSEAEIAGALSGLAERLPVTPPTLAAAVDAVREAWDADRSAGARSAAETTTALVTADRELAKLRAEVAELTVTRDRLLAREHEDGRLHAQLRAEVAELRARPVLTEDLLRGALDAHGHAALTRKLFAHLGPVTLPSPDRAEELVSAWRGICTDTATCDLDPAERMRRALASTLAIVDRPAPTPTPAPGLDLDAVERAERAMTPGPWEAKIYTTHVAGTSQETQWHEAIAGGPSSGTVVCETECSAFEDESAIGAVNIAGIVAIRNAAPALIAEVRALRAAAELERSPAPAGPGPVCRLCHGDRDRCGHFVGGGAG